MTLLGQPQSWVLGFAGVSTMLFFGATGIGRSEEYRLYQAIGVAGIATPKDPAWMK